MSKTKPSKSGSGRSNGVDKVREGRVSKPVESSSIKDKTLNGSAKKQAKAGVSEKPSKKVRAPSPPSSEDESEDESVGSSEDESVATSEGEAENETAAVSQPAKAAKAKVNGATPKPNGVKPSVAEASSDESDDSEGSESDEDEVVPAKAAKSNAQESSDESESDSDSDSAGAAAKPAAAKGQKGLKGEASSSEEDDESDASGEASGDSDVDESDNDDEESEEESAQAAAPKRKAEPIEEPAWKKQKMAEISEVKSLFVGGISWNIDEDWLKREFESFGEVTGCRIITHKDTGKSKGFGYIDFAQPADAAKALEEMNGAELDGRAIKVDLGGQRPSRDGQADGRDRSNSRAQQFGDVTSPPSDTLWLGNLSFDITADAIRENFEEYGSITRVSLPTHPEDGNLKGFGYVGFSSVAEAQAALDAWKGQALLGRPVRIDFSGPKPDNGFGAGRGRGGFDRGRGGFDRGRGGFRGRGGSDRGRGGFGDRGRGGFGGRGGGGRGDRGGRGGSTNRGGVGDFSGKKMTF